MAHVATSSASIGLKAPSGLVARLQTMLANYRLYRKTIEELESLTNRELQDLGITRFQIRQIAHETVYGR